MVVLVEVVHPAPCGIAIANIPREGIDSEVDFAVAVFAPAELPLAGVHGERGLIGCWLEVFNKEVVHGRVWLVARG